MPFPLDVDGCTRTGLLARAADPSAPLLVVLHGAGGTGAGMAALTRLHRRGPAVGVSVAFPDGVGRVWNDHRGAPRLRRREDVDDVAFLQQLVEQLAGPDADPRRVAFAGISNGALMSEHLARHALVPVGTIALVAGAATVRSRSEVPVPRRPCSVLLFAGTADPLVPFAGGPIGFSRLVGGRRSDAVGDLEPAPRGVAVAVESVAADWVVADGLGGVAPASVPVAGAGLPVTHVRWSAPGHRSVDLWRIDGGGHTWPGGTQYLPSRLVGPVAPGLDASGAILTAVRSR